MISNIKVDFAKIGSQSANHGDLKNYIASFSNGNAGNFTFSEAKVQARRTSNDDQPKIYNEDFQFEDSLRTSNLARLLAADNEARVEGI